MANVTKLPIPPRRNLENKANKQLSTGEELKKLKSASQKASAVMKYAVASKDQSLVQKAVDEKWGAEREAGLILIVMAQKGERRKVGRVWPHSNGSGPEPLDLADLGITKKDSYRWQIVARLDPAAFERAKLGAVRRAWNAWEKTKRDKDQPRPVPLVDGMQLRIGDCRKVLADVEDNSAALVLTDPPYAAEAEPLYRWLAEWSARVLIPGGSLICYTGHWSLNRDMQIFDEHLRYWWVMAMLHTQSRRLPGKFVIANFKPVLWYVKEKRRGNRLVPDVMKESKREKDDDEIADHEWGQGEAGVGHLIELLTEPGELVLDPFAGTAKWGQITAALGRRWIGSDVVEGGASEIEAA